MKPIANATQLAARAHANLHAIGEIRRVVLARHDVVSVIMMDVLASKQHEILELLEWHQVAMARESVAA